MVEENLSVVKRSGNKEQLVLDKIHKMVARACEGITGISQSQVEINSGLQFYDEIQTKDIQEILVKSAYDLISTDNPNYTYVAARLRLFALRKEVWQGTDAPKLINLVKKNVGAGVYDKAFLDYYTEEEIEKIESFIKHDRDLDFTYAGLRQCCDKYLVQDRTTKEFYETPQFAFVMIAATLFSQYPKETRLKYVKDYYDAISQYKISLPTPIIAGVRTPLRQYSSCVLIDVDDSLESLGSSNHAMMRYVAQRAGIGLNFGRVRREGASIRGGEVEHTGLIPFIQMFQATSKSCTQNGIRGGAVTAHYPFWHYDIEDFIVLKNNQGTEETRVRKMDHSIQLSKLFYERYMKDEYITLFSPHEVPQLYALFGHEGFDEMYEACERKTSISKRKIKARDLMHQILSERSETGRIYIMNIDHVNQHSHTELDIKMSNLCAEITLPTKPIQSIDDENGWVATCILSALNLGTVKPEEYEKICDLIVRGLNELIDYQGYPVKAAETYTKNQRSLGVGVINFAYLLAKHKLDWDSKEAYKLTHETFERYQYYLLKASNNLAKERGACAGFNSTKYSKGIMPIDTYKKDVDSIGDFDYKEDWDSLRESIIEHGLSNVCVSAIAPTESSSATSNATNGIEPPVEYMTIKGSKKGKFKIIVPEYQKLKNFYTLRYDMKSSVPYLNHAAIMQKFVDQSISTNTHYNPLHEHHVDDSVSLMTLVKDVFHAYKMGIKTLYYQNTYDMNENDEEVEDSGCESGACAI